MQILQSIIKFDLAKCNIFTFIIKEKIEQNQKLPFDKKLCSITSKIENRAKNR